MRAKKALKKEGRLIRLTLGFDGTRFEGWQSQLKGKTVQEVFEKALQRIFPDEKIDLISSSRTDSGVHARGMVAHFHTTKLTPAPEKIRDALNYYLPPDIVVFEARQARADFHARYSAKSKLYRYEIWNHRVRPLFEAPYRLWYSGPLDAPKMRRASRCLIGRHDFRAFMDSGDEKENTVRTVKRLSIQKKDPLITIEIEANGFLTHMVRVIVGTLIEVGRGKIDPTQVKKILLSKDRCQAGPTAKPQGLTLISVSY